MKTLKLMKNIRWISEHPKILSDEIEGLDFLNNMSEQIKKVISTESRHACLEFMKNCIIESNAIEECFSFEKEQPTERSKKEIWKAWLNLPGKNIDIDLYFENKHYRKGVRDALKLCRSEILVQMQLCEDGYIAIKDSLDK